VRVRGCGGKTKDLRSKERSQKVADDATDAMLCKDIQRIIDPNHILQLRRVVTADRAHDPEDDRAPRRHEPTRRRDGDETRHSARAETDCAPLLLEAVVEQDPGHAADRGSEMGNHARHDRTHVCSERGAAVEAEPADPEEDRAEHDVRDVVRTVRQSTHIVVSPPLAQHDGVGESSSAGRDVDWCATGEVQAAHFEGPACGVPGPASDGVVDYGAPDEHEDYAGQHAASVCCGTYRQSGTKLLVSFHLLLVDIEEEHT
jgi:hypothetical protein